MIWVCFAIAVILMIVAIATYNCWDDDDIALTVIILTVLLVLGFLIAGIVIGVEAQKLNYIDDKIEYLSEENAQIDEEILMIVSSYQEHEKEFYETFKNTSTTTLVNLYPEIKSNDLVTKQIDIYLANKQEIKDLELRKIEGGVIRWWAFFGH